jgi:hypothetical protein
MAHPVVEQVVESAASTTAVTNHVVTLPTATSGQLLLILMNIGAGAATVDAHGSLTELLDEGVANGLYIAYRWMDGTEPASYTLVTSANTRTASLAYRISGAENPATQAPQVGTTATGTNANANPPTSATPGSSKDFLFIALAGFIGEDADDDTWATASPTDYTPDPPRQKTAGTAGANLGGIITAAERQLTTGSAEDPGVFTIDNSRAWRTQTVMVHPTSALTVTAVTLTATPTFPTARVDHRLTAIALTATPTLPAATVTGVVNAATLTATPTQPAASLVTTVAAVTLSVTPTQPAGSIIHELTATTLSVTPTFPATTVAVFDFVTATTLTVTPTQPKAVLAVGALGTAARGPTGVTIRNPRNLAEVY